MRRASARSHKVASRGSTLAASCVANAAAAAMVSGLLRHIRARKCMRAHACTNAYIMSDAPSANVADSVFTLIIARTRARATYIAYYIPIALSNCAGWCGHARRRGDRATHRHTRGARASRPSSPIAVAPAPPNFLIMRSSDRSLTLCLAVRRA